jgi:hypothetical protein
MSPSVLLHVTLYAATLAMIGLAATEVRRRGLCWGARRLAVVVAVAAACTAGVLLAGGDASRGVLIGLLTAAFFGEELHGYLFSADRRDGRPR